MFFDLLQLVRGFLYEKYHLKKVLSSTEQASDETVAKNSQRYLSANPDRYISIYIKKESVKMLVWDIQRRSYICCGSILSLVEILFSFVFGYGKCMITSYE